MDRGGLLRVLLRVTVDAAVVAVVLFGTAGTVNWPRAWMLVAVLLGALYAIFPLSLLMLRIGLEERFLRRELPGYPEYMKRVPHRLLPGIW